MSKIKEKQAKRRLEIIESVVPIITQTSFEDISIASICEAIGISIGSFYHYFNSKSDLLIGLLWMIDDDLSANTFPLLVNENEIENLKLFAHGWAVHVATHGIERSKLISTINPESTDFVEQERLSTIKLREIMESGQKKGQITKQFHSELLAETFLLMMRSITLDWSRRDGNYPIVEKMDEHITISVRAFCPQHGDTVC